MSLRLASLSNVFAAATAAATVLAACGDSEGPSGEMAGTMGTAAAGDSDGASAGSTPTTADASSADDDDDDDDDADTTAAGPTSTTATSAATDADDSSGDTSASESTGAPVDPRPAVLLYRGGGASPPDGDFWDFTQFATLVEADGRAFDETQNWPGDIGVVGLVLLPNNADLFPPDQVDDLRSVLEAGGTVIVHNEWSAYDNTDNLNALLSALSSALSFQAGLYASAGSGTVLIDDVGTDPLMDGVTGMHVAAGSAVLGCDAATTLLTVEGVCFLAVEPHGQGQLLVFGDLDVVDNHALDVAGPSENPRFIANLLASLPPTQ